MAMYLGATRVSPTLLGGGGSFTETDPTVPAWAKAPSAPVTSVNGKTGAVTIGITATATLTSTGWTNNTQTVTVSGVTSSNIIIITPAPASMSVYGDYGVRCTSQDTNSLTFACDSVPSANLTVNILIL